MQPDFKNEGEDFAPMRFEEGDRHDDFENHVDEKWLVSYADLMTLLFGLFVMLYVITVQKQGNVQESFQQISDQMARTPSSAPVNRNTSTQKPQRYTDSQYLAAYYETQKLKKSIVDLNKELEILRPKANLTSNIDPDLYKQLTDQIKIVEEKLDAAEKKIGELKIENENLQRDHTNLKNQIADLESENKRNDLLISNLNKDIEKYKKEISNLKSENSAFQRKISSLSQELQTTQFDLEKTQKNLQTSLQKVKALEQENKQILAKKNEYEFILGKVNIDSPDVPSKPIRDLASLKTKISNASVLTLEQQTKMQADLAQSQQQVTDLSSKMTHLTKELAEAVKMQNSFIMISILWTTSKHDLDLKIRDPNGNTYTYKSTRKPASVGEFVMDSRTGPGMEAWHSLKFVPGEYEATVEFYNNYGNELPADISLVASTNSGRFEISKFDLDFKTRKNKTFKFKLDSTGQVIK